MVKWFLTLLLLSLMGQVQAGVIINLQGTSGSSTMSVSFSGTLTASSIVLGELQFTGFSSFVTTPFTFETITGSTQISGSFGSAALGSIAAPSASTLRIDVSPDKFTTPGETLTLSGSGSFTMTGLTFDDFTPGTYNGISDGFLLPTGAATLVISSTPIAAVPEPSTCAGLLCGLACFSIRRWRAASYKSNDA